ncbi:hypothetical protein JXQ70_01710 [bacterium]|nr:hypothetical protein [bacterium]
MKKSSAVLFSLFVLFGVSYAYADCPVNYVIGRNTCSVIEPTDGATYYGMPTPLAQNTMASLFYGWETDSAVGDETTNFNRWAWSYLFEWITWFENSGLGYWEVNGIWDDPGDEIMGCPYDPTNNFTVIMVAWDNLPAESLSPVKYTMFGMPFNAGMGSFGGYDADLITDGTLDIVECSGTQNNQVPLQLIPPITVQSYDSYSGTVNITFTTPHHYSYGETGHSEYLWGYSVYVYPIATMNIPPDHAPNSRRAFWTQTGLATGIFIDIASLPLNTEISHTIVFDDPRPCQDCTVYFAFAPIGRGLDGTATEIRTPFTSYFLGQESNPLFLNGGPGAIELISLDARSERGKAIIEWETGSELNTAGFNIMRTSASNSDLVVQVNDSLIPATGSSASGDYYSFVDNSVKVGGTYYYFLEEVELNNTKTRYGSVGTTIVGKQAVKQAAVVTQ